MAAWKNVLNSAGQAAVVQSIDQSPEARTDFMRHLYQRFLGRNPQNGEEQGWGNALASETEEQVLAQFLASAEFYNLAQNLVSSGTPDERFIQAMYQLVLNRQASSTEVTLGGRPTDPRPRWRGHGFCGVGRVSHRYGDGAL